jgi:hypothetical protein
LARSRSSDALLAALAALVGLIACWGVQGDCFAIPTEYRGRPQPGTPRAGYCAPIDHWYRWVLFPLAGALIALLLSRLLRALSHARLWSLIAVALLAVANYFWLNSLDYYVSI